MIRRVLFGIALSLLPVRVFAQAPPHMMHVVVNADRINIGATDFVPRCITQPATIAVPAGQSAPFPTSGTFDCIEVAGNIKVSRTQNTDVKVTNLFVLPGGNLDVGTAADPIPPTVTVSILIRDVAIDTTKDPFQWGNGLLNFGTQTRVGAKKLEWTTLTVAPAAGANSITLAESPDGWRVGDDLLLPDTTFGGHLRESPVKVAGIAGNVVTLSKGLDFAHPAMTDPKGATVLMPRVANLTRNIKIASENPLGTRGHTADVGHEASWITAYNELSGLGRTKGERLDSLVADPPHVGLNQVGRYTNHHHHAHGFGSSSTGNVYRGSQPNSVGKWGEALHGTHDALIERNIAVDFFGAGFVTEDGYEVRNTFRKNFSAYNLGNHDGDANIESANIRGNNNPGAAGDGFWFHGLSQFIEGNEAWCNNIGMNIFGRGVVAGWYPSVPGGEFDVFFPGSDDGSRLLGVRKWQDNVMAANRVMGLEFWSVIRFDAVHPMSYYNGLIQFFHGLSDPTEPHLVNIDFVGDHGKATGISTATPYSARIDIDGGRIVGNEYGMSGAAANARYFDLYWQNIGDIYWTDFPPFNNTMQDSNVHEPMPGRPPHYLIFKGAGGDPVWDGVGPFPVTPESHWILQRGAKHVIKNWQKSGKDYRLFTRQQLGSTACWPSTADSQQQYNAPEVGLTMLQCWQKYGMSFGSEALPEENVVEFEGLDGGYAAEGLAPVLGIPAIIMTYPREGTDPGPVVPQSTGPNGFNAYGLFTGDYTKASRDAFMTIDGGAPIILPVQADAFKFGLPVTTEGRHNVQTWRTDLAGKKIDASVRNFVYTVGPVAPPVDICPNLDGMQSTVPPGRQLVNGQCVCIPPTTDVGGTCVAPPPVDDWHPTGTPGVDQFGTQNRFRIKGNNGLFFEFQMK